MPTQESNFTKMLRYGLNAPQAELNQTIDTLNEIRASRFAPKTPKANAAGTAGAKTSATNPAAPKAALPEGRKRALRSDAGKPKKPRVDGQVAEAPRNTAEGTAIRPELPPPAPPVPATIAQEGEGLLAQGAGD